VEIITDYVDENKPEKQLLKQTGIWHYFSLTPGIKL
jgi:hypothetical protein